MGRVRSVFRFSVTLMFAVSLLLTATVSTAGADSTGTVTGSVMLDGKALPGVEVFLWAGYPRLTCTTANGEFTFDDVPFGIDLVSATGTGSPEHCDNYRFLAPDGDEMLAVFYDGHDGRATFDAFQVTAPNPTYTIDYEPRRAAADEIVCSGQLATLVGTAGDDVLIGGPDGDVIVAKAGNDTIRGKGGFDQICAGPGRDTVYGGADGDWVSGGSGADVIFGGSGDDVLLGEGGRDTVYGNAGKDVLWGFGGDDKLVGGAGSDTIRGNSGDDLLKGKKGADYLYGGGGTDKAAGGPGRDTCKAEVMSSC
ncbi:MAG: calcium-binding protein [bacterium]|nr:calcium-binding protein [bacterium]